MTLLSTATIAALVAIDESAMGDTVTITDVTRVSDGGGAYTETTATRTTTGYFWTLSGKQAGEDQARQFGAHRVTIPKTISIDGVDYITVNSAVYRIVYRFPLHGYSTSRMLGLEEHGGTIATPVSGTAGQPIGLLLALTKAA